jgi:hypothetical protein
VTGARWPAGFGNGGEVPATCERAMMLVRFYATWGVYRWWRRPQLVAGACPTARPRGGARLSTTMARYRGLGMLRSCLRGAGAHHECVGKLRRGRGGRTATPPSTETVAGREEEEPGGVDLGRSASIPRAGEASRAWRS